MITEEHLTRFVKVINGFGHDNQIMNDAAQELAEVVQEILIATGSKYRLDYDHHDLCWYITKGL